MTSQAQTTSSRFARRLVPVRARFLLFGATRVPAYRRCPLPLPFSLSPFTNRVSPRLLRLSFSLLSTGPPIPPRRCIGNANESRSNLAFENQIFIHLDDFGSNRSVTQRNATALASRRLFVPFRFVSFRLVSFSHLSYFLPFLRFVAFYRLRSPFPSFSFLPSRPFSSSLPPSLPLSLSASPFHAIFYTFATTTMPPVNSLFLRRSTIEII